MSPDRTALRWQAAETRALAWHEFDDALVVWNGRTRSTHLLESLQAEVFRALAAAGSPLTAGELADRLPDDASAADRRSLVESVLASFQAVGLASPVEP